MNRLIDVTADIEFGIIDEEFLPIEKCKCGKEFGYWDFFISNDKKYPTYCPECGRGFVFGASLSVYEVVHEDTAFVIAENLQVEVKS